MLYNALMIFSRLVRLLPYDALLFLGRILGNLYYLLIKKQRERAVAQMMPALNVSEDEARKTAKIARKVEVFAPMLYAVSLLS